MKLSPEIQNIASRYKSGRLLIKDATVSKMTNDNSAKVDLDIAIKDKAINKVAFRNIENPLSQASAALATDVFCGEPYAHICQARDLIWFLLNTGNRIWEKSSFEAFNVFESLCENPEIHDAILLPLDAVVEAMQISGKLSKAPYGDTHLWLGQFQSEDRFKEFLRETYDENLEIPMNEFAASQGQKFYDHDWIEAQFFEEENWESSYYYPGSPLRTDDVNTINFRAKMLGNDPFNGCITYLEPHCTPQNREFTHPQNYLVDGVNLIFIGSFKSNHSIQYW